MQFTTYDVMIDENDFPRREIHGGQNGHVSTVLERQMSNEINSAETSSVHSPDDQSLKKPKSGVFNKLNLAVRCMFTSKL